MSTVDNNGHLDRAPPDAIGWFVICQSARFPGTAGVYLIPSLAGRTWSPPAGGAFCVRLNIHDKLFFPIVGAMKNKKRVCDWITWP